MAMAGGAGTEMASPSGPVALLLAEAGGMLPGAAGILAGGGGPSGAGPEEAGARAGPPTGGSGTLSEAARAGGAVASEEETVPLGSVRRSLSAGRGAGAAAALAGAFPLLLSVRVHGPAKAAKPPKLTASPPASSFHRIHSMARCSSLKPRRCRQDTRLPLPPQKHHDRAPYTHPLPLCQRQLEPGN